MRMMSIPRNRNTNPNMSSCVIFFIGEKLRCRSNFEDRNNDLIFWDTGIVDHSLWHRAEYRVAIIVYELCFDYHVIDWLYLVRDVPALSTWCTILIRGNPEEIINMQILISLEVSEVLHLNRKLVWMTNFPKMIFIIGANEWFSSFMILLDDMPVLFWWYASENGKSDFFRHDREYW
jgi:hypothetical protein